MSDPLDYSPPPPKRSESESLLYISFVFLVPEFLMVLLLFSDNWKVAWFLGALSVLFAIWAIVKEPRRFSIWLTALLLTAISITIALMARF